MTSTDRPQAANTIAMLGQAYSLLGFKIVDGVVGAGYPQKPSHSAVFAQIKREGSRLTDLAKGANMTPQSMSELVAELVELGYVERKPDPTDGRAKLIVLTDRGNACIDAAQTTIQSLEDQLAAILGDRGHRQLRTLLTKLLADG